MLDGAKAVISAEAAETLRVRDGEAVRVKA
jgi:hypothetical protein